AIAVRDHARKRDLAGAALARLHVERVDARGRDAHPHLAGPRLGRGDVADAQNLCGGPIGFVVGGPHRRLPAGPRKKPTGGGCRPSLTAYPPLGPATPETPVHTPRGPGASRV